MPGQAITAARAPSDGVAVEDTKEEAELVQLPPRTIIDDPERVKLFQETIEQLDGNEHVRLLLSLERITTANVTGRVLEEAESESIVWIGKVGHDHLLVDPANKIEGIYRQKNVERVGLKPRRWRSDEPAEIELNEDRLVWFPEHQRPIVPFQNLTRLIGVPIELDIAPIPNEKEKLKRNWLQHNTLTYQAAFEEYEETERGLVAWFTKLSDGERIPIREAEHQFLKIHPMQSASDYVETNDCHGEVWSQAGSVHRADYLITQFAPGSPVFLDINLQKALRHTGETVSGRLQYEGTFVGMVDSPSWHRLVLVQTSEGEFGAFKFEEIERIVPRAPQGESRDKWRVDKSVDLMK